jgi:NAD:arginine ADP-ribosyltransferase
MAPLAVDPQVLDGAGAAVISAGEGLGSVISTLTAALAGCDGMAGDDPAGAAFGHTYDRSASKLLEAMATTRNGLCRLGDGVRVSAHNYSAAEAMSNVSGHSQPLPIPHQTGSISAGSAPSAVGNGVAAPAGWGWVSKYIGMIWPNGDSAKLRAAGATWTSAGTQFEVSEILGAVGPMGSIGAQQIPEGPAITTAFGAANRSAAGILQQCATIATQLNSLATKIDKVRAAILDLLSRICNPLTGLKEVWEFLTDEDEDEIRKIANDIRIIVNQFIAEVDALRQEIANTLSEAATILSTMARYAEKEWDHFLHDTDVGRSLDHVGQMFKGVFAEAEGLVKGLWDLSPVRAVVDPDGFWHSVSGTVDKLESLTGLEGEQRLKDSWKELGKDTVHWDDWSTNPYQAAGESLFDLATLAVPGGALSKLPKLGRLAADSAERSEELHPAALLRETAPPQANPTTQNEPPRGGQPAPAPKPKEPLPPYGLTESKNPVSQKQSTDTAPRPVTTATHAPSSPPAAAIHGSAGTPSASLPLSPTVKHPHGGAPSTCSPASAMNDHHGPVAHADDHVAARPLTFGELSALADYTGLGHEGLNDALRSGNVDASQQTRVDALNRALDKLPPHNGPVFRGTDLPPEVLAQYQPGAVVSESAFLSTSMDLGVAQSTAFAGNVEFRILSKTGRDISLISMFPSEREVLFGTGVPFYVIDRRPDHVTGRIVIEMIEQ